MHATRDLLACILSISQESEHYREPRYLTSRKCAERPVGHDVHRRERERAAPVGHMTRYMLVQMCILFRAR